MTIMSGIKAGLKVLFIMQLCFISISSVSALESSIPVEVTIDSTTLKVTGYASPNVLVTVENSNTVVGTTSADSTGKFSLVMLIDPVIHNISVSYTDSAQNKSPVFKQSVSIQPQKQTVINTFLGPTLIREGNKTVANGTLVQLSGFTAANALVSLSVDFNNLIYTATSGSDGHYTILINSAQLGIGNYTAETSAVLNTLNSEKSKKASFNIVSSNVNTPSAPDIIVRPEQLPPPTPLRPENNAEIDGDSVVISGESVPFAQINIYEDSSLYGSIFADNFGSWSFLYKATYSPVIMSFEACFEGVCSVLSKTLTLTFNGIPKTCSSMFSLGEYRYWLVKKGEEISLDVYKSSGDGILEIDWGDQSPEEKFDHSANRPTTYTYSYRRAGRYNGSVRFIQGECSIIRYFSVAVVSEEPNNNSSFYKLSFITFILMPISYAANRIGRRYSPIKKEDGPL